MYCNFMLCYATLHYVTLYYVTLKPSFSQLLKVLKNGCLAVTSLLSADVVIL